MSISNEQDFHRHLRQGRALGVSGRLILSYARWKSPKRFMAYDGYKTKEYMLDEYAAHLFEHLLIPLPLQRLVAEFKEEEGLWDHEKESVLLKELYDGYAKGLLRFADDPVFSRYDRAILFDAPVMHPINEWTLPFPTKVTLYPTNACNLRCRHCAVSAPAKKIRKDELSLGEITGIIDQVEEWGAFGFRINGGEPTLRKDIVQIIEYAGSKRYELSFFTNGFHVTSEVLDALTCCAHQKGEGFAAHLSLDGATAATHDWLRGIPGAFNRTIRIAEIFQARGILYDFESCIFPGNISEIKGIIQIAGRLGARSLSMHPIDYVGLARHDPSLHLSLCVCRDVSTQVKLLKERYNGKLGFTFGVQGMPHILEDKKVQRRVLLQRTLRGENDLSAPVHCGAGNQKILVTGNGDVYACESAVVDGLQVGNMRRESLLEIWHDEKRWRHLRGGLTLRDLHLCPQCDHFRICEDYRVCRLVAQTTVGDFYGPLPRCIHEYEELGIKRQDIERHISTYETGCIQLVGIENCSAIAGGDS